MEKISVICVNWNVGESFTRCIKSVLDTKYPNLELILIDNNSHKPPKIPQDPKVTYIQNSSNIGLPRAWNQGLKKATGEYLLVLNPDTRLPKDFFEVELALLKSDPKIGVVGPKFVDTDGTLQGSVFPEPSILNTLLHKNKYTPDSKIPVEVNSVSGACLFFSRKTLDVIGPFTEEVFMFFEDMDFCRRLRLVGLKNIFDPRVAIIHGHGQSTKQTSPDKYRNLWEIIIYPIRKLLNKPNTLPSAQRYRTEAGIWYNGWLKQLIIALILWTSEKLKLLK
ncbi:glycosyltransferase family 2 protein [Candidatus Amesbacteria bacterium]|nr:glycosyltransferase family 2 protein [Candidatus Amesbacteria bacterium]